MEKVDKKLVFYGGGKMAEGIIRGLIQNGTAVPEMIAVQELIPARCDYLSDTYGVTAKTDATEEIKGADMVLIGVNPYQVANVAKSLKKILQPETIVLSYACGVEIKVMEEELGSDKKIARLIPNTLNQSGNGYSAVHVNENLSEEDKDFVHNLALGLGKVIYLEESKFNGFQAFGCTGPLWIYKFIEAMIDAGIYVGFTREEASQMTIENLLGVAKVLQMTGASPTARIEELTSPGGVTIEALRVLQESGSYMTPTITSVEAAVEKCAAVAKK